MARTIKMSLSTDSINKAIKEITAYKNSLVYKTELFAKTLSQKGVQIARAKVITYDATFTNELLNSIVSEKKSSKEAKFVFVVKADSEHAVWVEFGVGQLGQEGSYPYPFPDDISWEYNSGHTIFEISPGQYGWFFPMPDGTWRFTQGMPSRPFMYETSIDLVGITESVARQIFR